MSAMPMSVITKLVKPTMTDCISALASASGRRGVRGIVLYTGSRVLPHQRNADFPFAALANDIVDSPTRCDILTVSSRIEAEFTAKNISHIFGRAKSGGIGYLGNSHICFAEQLFGCSKWWRRISSAGVRPSILEKRRSKARLEIPVCAATSST